MFAPQTQNEIPNILMSGARSQSDIINAGTNQRSNMINQAGQTAGNALGGAVSQWKKTAAQTDRNAGVYDAYSAMNVQAEQKTGSPIVPWDSFNALAGEKNQDKVSGNLAAWSPMFDSYLQQTRQIAVAEAEYKPRTTASRPMFGVGVADGVNIFGGKGNGK